MTRRVRLTQQARQDVLDIWKYIARDNEPAANRLLDQFTAVYEKLVRHPEMGVRQDQHRPGLRCFPVGRYAIFYRVRDGDIEIYRILHSARKHEDLL